MATARENGVTPGASPRTRGGDITHDDLDGTDGLDEAPPAEPTADERALLDEMPSLGDVGPSRRSLRDVHLIETESVEGDDTIVNPLGVKGMGELGMVGIPAAIANAAFHATGKRIRELPITAEKLL